MADNRDPAITDLIDLPICLPPEIFTTAMPAAGVPDARVSAVMGTLSRVCRGAHGFFKIPLAESFFKQLWEAVINGKQETVVYLSNKRPDLFLLLLTQSIPGRYVIKNKLTFHKFDLQGETLLSAPVKLKQFKMIETLISCSKQLEQTPFLKEAIAKALSQWKYYDVIVDPQNNNEEEIVIPPEYMARAQLLIDAFKEETFPNGVPGALCADGVTRIPLNVALSDKTE